VQRQPADGHEREARRDHQSPFASARDQARFVALGVRDHPWRVALMAGVVVVAVVFAWRVLAVTTPAAPEAQLPLATRGAERDPVSPGTTRRSDVVVHVAGAVVRPGVYRLTDDARTVDAIDAAGGPRGDADLARVNLAARLSDGLRVYVPVVGEAPVPPVEAAGSASSAGPLDLNSATAEQLDDLPGIGPATAAAIVAHRREHGPFQSIEQLLDVRGIGPAKLEQIRASLVV
jgi:competence protein ComEA